MGERGFVLSPCLAAWILQRKCFIIVKILLVIIYTNNLLLRLTAAQLLGRSIGTSAQEVRGDSAERSQGQGAKGQDPRQLHFSCLPLKLCQFMFIIKWK